jgi:hypothetical protein
MPENQESHLVQKDRADTASLSEIIQPEVLVKPLLFKRRTFQIFSCIGLFSLAGYCFAEFLQLRGYVNVYGSRLFLAAATLSLVLLGALWSANLSKWKWPFGIAITVVVIVVAIFVDRITLSHTKPIQGPSTMPPPSAAQPPSVDQLAAALAKKLEPSDKQRPLTRSSTLFPVLVKIHIAPSDTLTVVNEGKSGITDLELGWAKFSFSAEAAAQRKIVVSGAIYPSGAFPLAARIASKGTFQIDLEKLLPFDGQFLDVTPYMPGWPYAEFGLRITFRDEQTNLKYACYKVMSSIKHMPERWGDETSTTDTDGKADWRNDIYSEVLTRTRSHYSNDGGVDLQCDH